MKNTLQIGKIIQRKEFDAYSTIAQAVGENSVEIWSGKECVHLTLPEFKWLLAKGLELFEEPEQGQ